MGKFFKIIYVIFFLIIAVVLLRFFLLLALIILLLLWLRTFQMKKEPNQKDFSQGFLPHPNLDGFYQGDTGFDTFWMGKKFVAGNGSGVNVFKDKKGNQIEKYPFVISVGRGLFDDQMMVLRLDYNIKGNPFWLRCVLDEVVQIGPDHYLGKMHLKIISGFHLAFCILN